MSKYIMQYSLFYSIIKNKNEMKQMLIITDLIIILKKTTDFDLFGKKIPLH